MAQIVGTVVQVVGAVYARNAEGKVRELSEGDTLFEGEQVLRSPGSQVELETPEGLTQLAANVDGDVSGILASHSMSGTQSTPEEEDISGLQAALISYDGDLMDLLEDTAAGVGASNYGSSFVRLGRLELDTPEFGASGRLPIFDAEQVDNGVSAAGNEEGLEAEEPEEQEGEIFSTTSPEIVPAPGPTSPPVEATTTTAEAPVEDNSEESVPPESETPVSEIEEEAGFEEPGDSESSGAETPPESNTPTQEATPESEPELLPPENPAPEPIPELLAPILSFPPQPVYRSAELTIESASVNEGSGEVMLMASLDASPGQVFEVVLSNGASFVFDADYIAGTPIASSAIPVQSDDAILDGTTLNLSVVEYTEGAFDAVTIPPEVNLTVSDTIDTTAVSLSSNDVSKGGDITVSATVNNAPESDLKIVLSNAETIVIKAGQTEGSVTFVGPSGLDMGADGLSLALDIVSSTGGGYENLSTDASVSVQILNSAPSVSVRAHVGVLEGDDVESVVLEAGLEPGGSAAGDSASTTGGAITLSDKDGLGDLTGIRVTDTSSDGGARDISIAELAAVDAADSDTWLSFSGAHGTVTLTDYEEGVIAYVYELGGAVMHQDDPVADEFLIAVSDDNATYSDPASIGVKIFDDQVTAIDDVNSVDAGTYAPVAGNVIAENDVEGADGAAVTAVSGSVVEGYSGNFDFAVSGSFGVLEINADGSYQYTRAAGSPGGVSESFTYTVTDGDQDSDVATLTVEIGDSGVNIDAPDVGEAGTQVSEAGLSTSVTGGPAGSGESLDGDGANNSDNSEVTTGTIGFSGDDAPLRVYIDNDGVLTEVTAANQVFQGSYGALTVTAISSSSVDYSYTLTETTAGSSVFDSFNVRVVDIDGDQSDDALVISIVDDAPVAIDDAKAIDGLAGTSDSGNVLVNSADGDAADLAGADGGRFSITEVRTGSEADTLGVVSGVLGSPLEGDYGALTMNADGEYSYQLTADLTALDSDEPVYDIFTYTVADADGSHDSAQLTITINPLNDLPTIIAEFGPIEIYTTNVTQTDEGFTVSAFDLNGDPAEISINGRPSGFGVAGLGSGADSELGYRDGESESLIVSFDTQVYGAEVSFAWMNSREGASFTFLREGEIVGTGEHRSGSDRVDPAITLRPENGESFDEIVFAAPGRGDDYLIHSIVANYVYEAGLESGSGSGPVTTKVAGTFQVADPDGLDDIESVSVNGVVSGITELLSGTASFSGSKGALHIESFDVTTGIASYTYTLEQVVDKTFESAIEEFVFSVTDGEGVATSSVQIEIIADPAGSNDAPVAIDLDGNGIEYLELSTGVTFIDEAGGAPKQTAWVGPDDGLLVIDADDSGTINHSNEYVFTGWSDTAGTDLEAIAEVFDSNQDGVLDRSDDRFGQFAVWQDADSDGVTDDGELTALTELGVDAIALRYRDESDARSEAGGDVTIFGQSDVYFADGSITTAEDASFAISVLDVLPVDDGVILPANDAEYDPVMTVSPKANTSGVSEFDVGSAYVDLPAVTAKVSEDPGSDFSS